MKNYIITSNEYDIVNKRLERLNERKEKLTLAITRVTSQQLSEDPIHSGILQDKMTNYVAEMEEIEEEIRELEEEAIKLKSDLEYMDSRLSNIEDLKEQVFVMFYIRGMKPKDIAPKVYCDISTVYKKLKEINKERELAKKSQKFCNII